MEISVVIPVRNDATRLNACLASITKDRASFATEIVVADNGSTDPSPQVAKDAGARVLSLPNLAVGELRNVAAREAAGRLLAFIDSDHEIESGWMSAANEAFQDPNVGAAGALCLAPPAGTWVQQMYGALRGRTHGKSETSWLGAGNMVVRRDVFDRVGGFDTSLMACEDVDLCRRVRAAGWKIVADERLKNVHHGDPKTLGALFRAERWRGRDNLRVSLRGPIGLRDIPSIVIPILTLAALAALPLGILGVGPGFVIAVIASAILIALLAARTARMVRGMHDTSMRALGRAISVAAAYDLARALALVTRAPHHRR